MLRLTIEIEGSHHDALKLAIERVRSLVAEQYLCGADSNDTGSFSFDITGEEEEDEEEDDDGQRD